MRFKHMCKPSFMDTIAMCVIDSTVYHELRLSSNSLTSYPENEIIHSKLKSQYCFLTKAANYIQPASITVILQVTLL